jgi:hypothetical protein
MIQEHGVAIRFFLPPYSSSFPLFTPRLGHPAPLMLRVGELFIRGRLSFLALGCLAELLWPLLR